MADKAMLLHLAMTEACMERLRREGTVEEKTDDFIVRISYLTEKPAAGVAGEGFYITESGRKAGEDLYLTESGRKAKAAK